ncbi:signal transduction histidine kinase [Sphingobacterium sp. JUb78]|nr:signal transduction histidine kinase [Sphingobacterium sp. JUb78]
MSQNLAVAIKVSFEYHICIFCSLFSPQSMIAFDSYILSVLHHSPQATAIYNNGDLNIAYANQGMLDIWCADESIIGKTLCACFPNFVQEGFCSILKNVWKTGITYNATEVAANIVVGDRKIKRYFDFEYKAILDEKGQTYAILHTASDVTERKLANNKMERQREELSLSYKLDRLASTLSHDLKNPLSVLKMGNDFLLKNEDLSVDVAKRWYKNFSESIQNIESIINQTLQLNKVRGSKNMADCVEIDKRIGEWINEVKLNFPERQIEFQLGHLYSLNADSGAVYQIFVNLIGNAVKFANSKGAYLHIDSEETDQGIVYIFEDNGIGIPEDELTKVLLMEVRGTNSSHIVGSGIGLSLVKDLMEFMGGTINLSSAIGKGTVVRLFFPQSVEDC